MEVPYYRPVYYGQVTNGILTADVSLNPRNLSSSQSSIEALKEENEALKTKVELLEIQIKFILSKFTEVEKFTENRNGST